jgi:putative transposase
MTIVHLLLTASEARSPSRMMQALGRRYVRYFNDRFERTGTLWEGRFRSSVIDSERYFFQCSRYIETNPVRAGLATRPSDYRWSSYRCNANGAPDVLVTAHPIYRTLGDDDASRRDAYRALFASPLDTEAIDDMRVATRRGTAPAVEAQRRASNSDAAPRWALQRAAGRSRSARCLCSPSPLWAVG